MGHHVLPDSMPAAVYRGPGRIEVEDVPVPAPGSGQVLVEVDHCGVCGSDLHLLVEGWGKPGTIAGHELTGMVRATGAGVDRWRDGDRVVLGPMPRCGNCRRCRQGKPSQCERRDHAVDEHLGGGFSRYFVTDARSLLPLPEGLAPRAAALAEPLAVALHAITRAGLEPGDDVMIFGAGPIGALAAATLVARGGHRVTMVEPSPVRQDLARHLGVDAVLGPEEVTQFPMWEPERLAEQAVDVVLECSGNKAAMEAGLHQLRRGGRLVIVGPGMAQPSFDPNRLLLNELQILGSFVYDEDGFDVALELLASGALPLDVLVEPEDVTLDRLGGVLAELARGTIAGKVLVVPRRAGQ
ncbi:MAG TPA: alcohol dehydrogenase catalytic domain-containing protein [Acidimicrobiales bacterium]|nr:alcohol dehydrogenase catalytic domain-containing protein [Acidimicrobiales bacterium]